MGRASLPMHQFPSAAPCCHRTNSALLPLPLSLASRACLPGIFFHGAQPAVPARHPLERHAMAAPAASMRRPTNRPRFRHSARGFATSQAHPATKLRPSCMRATSMPCCHCTRACRHLAPGLPRECSASSLYKSSNGGFASLAAISTSSPSSPSPNQTSNRSSQLELRMSAEPPPSLPAASMNSGQPRRRHGVS